MGYIFARLCLTGTVALCAKLNVHFLATAHLYVWATALAIADDPAVA